MSGAQLQLPDWIDTTGCLPPNLQVQKVFCLRPLRVRLAAVLDLKSQKVVRAKVSVKERLLNGNIHYFPRRQELEYCKRFQVFGLASATVWVRWDLRRIYSAPPTSAAFWQPRVGFSLGLGGNSLLALGCGLRSAASLLNHGPLTYPFKTSLGSREKGPRFKAYWEVSLAKRLIFGDDNNDDGYDNAEYEYDTNRADGAGGGGGDSSSNFPLRLKLRTTALVLSL